jgi:hypothetical protein
VSTVMNLLVLAALSYNHSHGNAVKVFWELWEFGN